MSTIEAQVAALPELYQPIFGHPELSEGRSRASDDRLAHIVQLYQVVERILGRPLRVLDLGCAQGYFSLNLAALGAQVQGVDYLEQNVEVCRALAAEHPEYSATFTFGKVQAFLDTVEPEQFDLVLGLSVFHHLVYDLGKAHIQAMLEGLLHKITVFVGEFALAEEPLYWGEAQPEDPRYLLENSAFLHELDRHPTHLADIDRPLYVASNRIWYLDGQGERFISWTPDSHALANGAHQGARRYYVSDEHFVKVFRVTGAFGERNRIELAREAQLLQHPPTGFSAPRHIVSGGNPSESWLVCDRIPGKLLLDAIAQGEPLDSRGIILDVLKQLVVLEQHGLYHDDVRAWNVMLDAEGRARLIDFGSIGDQPNDCVWPHNLFLAFMIFVREVVTGQVDQPLPLREIAPSPYGLPQPYANWINRFWSMPVSTWSFRCLLDALEQAPEQGDAPLPDTATVLWMSSIEAALQAVKKHVNHVEHQESGTRSAIEARLTALDEKGDRLSQVYERHLADMEREQHRLADALQQQRLANEALSERLQDAEAEKNRWLHLASEYEARAHAHEGQASEHAAWAAASEASAAESAQRVQVLLDSTSWRITQPLRTTVIQAKRATRKLLRVGKASARKGLITAIRKVAARPTIKRRLIGLVNHSPRLAARLRLFVRNQDLAGHRPVGGGMPGMDTHNVRAGSDALSARGQAVLHKFEQAMKMKDGH